MECKCFECEGYKVCYGQDGWATDKHPFIRKQNAERVKKIEPLATMMRALRQQILLRSKHTNGAES